MAASCQCIGLVVFIPNAADASGRLNSWGITKSQFCNRQAILSFKAVVGFLIDTVKCAIVQFNRSHKTWDHSILIRNGKVIVTIQITWRCHSSNCRHLPVITSTVDSPYKILLGTQDLGSILYHLYGVWMGYLIRSELCSWNHDMRPPEKASYGAKYLILECLITRVYCITER